MAAVEHRRRGLALIMMVVEADFFDLEEDTSAPKKKKRSMWVKPFLLRRNDPTCDTMFTISGGECQCEKSSARVFEMKIEQSLTICLIY